MTTKYFPTFLIIVLTLSMSAFAQKGQGRSQRNGMGMANLTVKERVTTMISRMDAPLSLSEDQKTKLTDLYTTHFEAMDARRGSGTRATQQERIAFQTAMVSSVKDILTTEQANQFDKIKSQIMPVPRQGQNQSMKQGLGNKGGKSCRNW